MVEINKASARLYEEQRQKQKEDVAKLISIVDTVSINYSASADRYSNKSIIIKNHVVQFEEDICVTKLFKAICLFADETTDQENEEYDAFLNEELKPPIIYSPELPQPRIVWNQLNKNVLKNLPKPEKWAITSCAPDEEFYSATSSFLGYKHLKYEEGIAFGTDYGFLTDFGVVPPPDFPINGYKFSTEWGTWVIAAGGG